MLGSASGEEPAAAAAAAAAASSQAAVNTQTAVVLLNTASQSHLSHCVKQSSIHPPDKNTQLYPSPRQAPEVLNLFSPHNPTPAGTAPHYTLEKKPKKKCVFIYLFKYIYIYFFMGERIGGGFASPWAF